MKKLITISLIVLMTSIHGLCMQEVADNLNAKFLLYSDSTKANSMGDAYVAVGGIGGILINPAGIITSDRLEFALSSSMLIDENTLGTIHGVLPIKGKYAIGISFLGFSTPDEKIYDFDGIETGDSITYGGNMFALTGAAKIYKELAFGFSVKSIAEDIVGYEESVTDFDMGFLYKYDYENSKLHLGLSMNNTVGDPIHGGNVPTKNHIGAAYFINDFLLSVEIFQADSLDSEFRFGGEYNYQDIFKPRIGFREGNTEDKVSLGFGLHYRASYLNYALYPRNTFGAMHRVAVGAKFGKSVSGDSVKTPRKRKDKKKAPPKIKRKKAGEKLNIAVANLDGKNVSAMDAAIVSDFIRTELVKTQEFKVLDRQNMERVLSEQSFQMSGCTTEECAVQMGKILNVQYMVVGTFSKFLETYYINSSVVDVESGEIVTAETAECSSGKELPQAAQKLAEALADRFR